MAPALRIDAYFDLICPWCWIGKSLLLQARERLAASDPQACVEVYWHSVQLIADVPEEGWPYVAFYERRLGSALAVRTRQAQVLEAASRAGGVTIDFARIVTFPNTRQAHRLLAQAAPQLAPAAFEALLQRLFEAYFQRGENLGDADTLARIARQHSVDLAAEPGQPIPEVWGAQGGVSGVPFFVFNRRRALSGAQPVEVLLAAMQQCARDTESAAS